jgi:epoxyqueuosine reductase
MRKSGPGLTLQDVEHFILQFVRECPQNSLSPLMASPVFDQPVIGIADGYDPLFQEYKKIIGDFYLTPAEIIRETAVLKQISNRGEEISVICWVMPFSVQVKRSNDGISSWPPSPIWSQGTLKGEELNNQLRRELVQHLSDLEYLAVAPVQSPLWHRPDRYTSNWSERHALYAAGMGTFSLNRGFISKKGICMRCGSVVVNAGMEATPRTCASHTENCLLYSKGTCGKCIERCPAKAITPQGHDKILCREYRDKAFSLLKKDGWKEAEPACGLCQTGVPCESGVPPFSPRY